MRKMTELIGSRRFFGATIVLFAIETFWLAITSRFPMAFDEAYHLGLIQFFSHRWNPLVTSQPPSTYKYGAIVHDPSWLYHYLMSFPYRFIELFTHNIVVLVIGMRLIDVALMIVNLFILRKLLQLIGLSGSLANLVLVVFAFTPMVTVLSAQISYDDLMIPLTTLSLYVTILLVRELNEKRFNVRRILFLVCLCLLASLVKFTFIPIMIGIFIVVAWKVVAYWFEDRTRLLKQVVTDFNKSSLYLRITILMAAALSVFLFSWFYGANTIRYHTPVPECSQVISKEACLQNYSWNISYHTRQYFQAHPGSAMHMTITQFTLIHWAFYMSEQLYGGIIPIEGLTYMSAPLFALVIMFFAAAVVCLFINLKEIIKKYPQLMTLLIISSVYIIFLWVDNYLNFRQSGQPSAINGRYLVPVLAYLYAVFGISVSRLLRRTNSSGVASFALAVMIIVIFIVFGGFSQYVNDITPSYGRLSGTNKFVLKSFGQ